MCEAQSASEVVINDLHNMQHNHLKLMAASWSEMGKDWGRRKCNGLKCRTDIEGSAIACNMRRGNAISWIEVKVKSSA